MTYIAHWHDAVGREIATADYGTNGGSPLSRPATVPTRSDTVLVTTTEYNDRGEAFKTIDPAGKQDRQEFDDAGRRTRLIENYVDGDPATGGADEDLTTEWTYTPDGAVATLTAKNRDTGDQVTRYVYGTTLSDSDIATSHLLRAEIYPDSDDTSDPLGDGPDAVYDRIEHRYNRQSERKETKDQNGTVRAFSYDQFGRPIHDRVMTLGTAVDAAVRRISTMYEVRGLPEKVTSWSDPTAGYGSIVNEVQFEYNNFGQLVTEYQSHSGAVDTMNTPKVQYGYADGSANHVRPTSVTYPNGRVLSYDYGAANGMDDAASRVQAIKDGTLPLAQYTYLGLGTSVEVDYTEPDVKYTLVDLALSNDPDTGDVYSGLDRFGRVKDSRWHNYAGSADVDRIKYGYDRAGNRLWRENVVAAANGSDFDELYRYDGLHRLKDFGRGRLNATKDGLSTFTFAQAWSLDPTGNWSNFKEDQNGDATWDLDQNRTANRVNEITDLAETTGPAWITPAYDRAGNMITMPKPADPTASFAGTFDAWNRLVKIVEGANTLAEYQYDGAKRRIAKKLYAAGVLDETRHLFYSSPDEWHVLEERIDASTAAERQLVWGLRYIDDLVLRDRDTVGDGTLDERLYALQDANWNVTAITDATGAVQERYAYDAYGPPNFLSAGFIPQTGSPANWTVLFTGYLLEADTRLYAVRNRDLHSTLAAWLERDPLGHRVDADPRRSPVLRGQTGWRKPEINLYEYASSNPVALLDPMGLQTSLNHPKSAPIVREVLGRPPIRRGLGRPPIRPRLGRPVRPGHGRPVKPGSGRPGSPTRVRPSPDQGLSVPSPSAGGLATGIFDAFNDALCNVWPGGVAPEPKRTPATQPAASACGVAGGILEGVSTTLSGTGHEPACCAWIRKDGGQVIRRDVMCPSRFSLWLCCFVAFPKYLKREDYLGMPERTHWGECTDRF